MSKKSQRLRILDYLKRSPKKGLTSMEAFEKFNCTRLSARIAELKKGGCVIDREDVYKEDGTHYGVYRLIKLGEATE